MFTLVPGHQPAGGCDHTPPRELTIGVTKDSSDRAGGSGISGFGGHLAIADQVARSEGKDHLAYCRLERREIVSHSLQPSFEPDELDRHLHTWD